MGACESPPNLGHLRANRDPYMQIRRFSSPDPPSGLLDIQTSFYPAQELTSSTLSVSIRPDPSQRLLANGSLFPS